MIAIDDELVEMAGTVLTEAEHLYDLMVYLEGREVDFEHFDTLEESLDDAWGRLLYLRAAICDMLGINRAEVFA